MRIHPLVTLTVLASLQIVSTPPAVARLSHLGFSLQNRAEPSPLPFSDVHLKVVDELTGSAISGASVTLSDGLRAGMQTPPESTKEDGTLTSPGALLSKSSLTVSKEGYCTLTLLGLKSNEVTVFLKALQPPADSPEKDRILSSGEMLGWSAVPKDEIQAGIIFKSLSVWDLLQFETESFISPLKDQIDVLGPREIPSNLILPEQRIPLLFGTLYLNKPIYRLPVQRNREFRLTGIQASIPSSELVSLFQGGKPTVELINRLRFRKLGITPALTSDRDLKVDLQTPYILKPGIKANANRPPFPSDVFVVSATDLEGDHSLFIPNDVKLALKSDETTLPKTVSLGFADFAGPSLRNVIGFAVASKGRRLTGILQGYTGGTAHLSGFLNVEEPQNLNSMPDEFQLSSSPQSIQALYFESRNEPHWKVYSLPGTPDSPIPTQMLAPKTQVETINRFQLELGPHFEGTQIDGATALRELKRFTRSSTRLKL